MANRYWVGNGGNWNDTNHWSASSGGAGGASVPTSSDDVFFDANSFSQNNEVITLIYGWDTCQCRHIDFSGINRTGIKFSENSSRAGLFVYGNFVGSSNIGAPVDYKYPELHFMATSGAYTITLNGMGASARCFDRVYIGPGTTGNTSSWSLQDSFHLTDELHHESGTFNTNGQSLTARYFYCGRTGGYRATHTLTLGSSQITCSRLFFYNVVDLTLNYNTSKFIINATIGGWTTTCILDRDGVADITLYDLQFNNTVSVRSNFIVANTITVDKNIAVNIRYGMILTINSFSTDADIGNHITIQSDTPGNTASLVKTSGTVNINYAEIKDIVTSGGATFNVVDGVNLGNNTGIVFVYTAGASVSVAADSSSSGSKINPAEGASSCSATTSSAGCKVNYGTGDTTSALADASSDANYTVGSDGASAECAVTVSVAANYIVGAAGALSCAATAAGEMSLAVHSVVFEEGTTNLVTNPFLGGTYTGGLAENWTKNDTPTLTENSDTDYITYGDTSQRVQAVAADQGIYQAITVVSGQAHTSKVRVYIVSGSVFIRTRFGTVANNLTETITGAGWHEVIKSAVTDGVNGEILIVSSGGAAEFYIDAAQLEQKAYDTSFTDVVRQPDKLYYTLNNALFSACGGCLRYKPFHSSYDTPVATSRTLCAITNSDGSDVSYSIRHVYNGATSQIAFAKKGRSVLYSGAITFSPSDEIFVAWSDDPEEGKLRLSVGISGAALITVESTDTVPSSVVSTRVYLGCFAETAGHEADGCIRNLNIFNRGLSAVDMDDYYDEAQTLTVDSWCALRLFASDALTPESSNFWLSNVVDISSATDKQTGVVSWVGDSSAAGTAIIMRAQTSADGIVWSDLDLIGNGDYILNAASNASYVRLMAILQTTIAGNSPEVQEIILSFNQILNPLLLSTMPLTTSYSAVEYKDVLYITNGVDTPRKLSGLTMLTLGGTPPTGKFIALYKNHIMIAGDPTYPDRISYSGLDSPESWGVTDYDDVVTSEGDPITGLFLHGALDALVIAKMSSLHVLQGASVDSFTIRQVAGNIGIIAQDSVASTPVGVIFASTDGIYLFDGYNTVPIFGKLKNTWRTGINKKMLSKAVGIYYEGKYYLFIASSNSVLLDEVFVLDLEKDTRPWTRFSGWEVASAAIYKEYNEAYLLLGDSDGQIHKFSEDLVTDNGVGITAYVETRDTDGGSLEVIKRFRQLFVDSSNTENININLIVDKQPSLTAPVTKVTGKQLAVKRVIPSQYGVNLGRTLGVKATITAATHDFTLYSLVMEAMTKRMRADV